MAASSPARFHICGPFAVSRQERKTITLITEMMVPPASRGEEETMHLFDTRAAEERAPCEADVEGLRVGADELDRNAAGAPADGAGRDQARNRNSAENRRLEADGLEDEARELRRLVERLRSETGLNGSVR